MIKNIFFIVTSVCLIYFFSNNVKAVDPDEILQNQEQELRARDISKNIRCMICQNQSIDESNAPLAKDLRVLIREKIKQGKDNEEIYQFLTDRYGDFVLLKPPLKTNTIILWIFPFVLLLLSLFLIYLHNKNSNKRLDDSS